MMSFQIERGLFAFDFTDHHAILGMPVDADTPSIRKRYLKIARRLHPDSFVSDSESEKQRASEFFSKLVSPAWERLSQEKERVEYDITLKMVAVQRGKQAEATLSPKGKEMLTANNPEHFYKTALKELAEKQYDHLEQSLDIIGQISELNMIYLMRTQGGGAGAASSGKPYTGSGVPDSSQQARRPTATQAAPAPQPRETVTEQYCRRAEGYVAKGNYAQAVLELRDALQMDPKNARCHALLGSVYLRQKQPTMARIHFTKALELDPENELAIAGKTQLEAKPAAQTGAQAGKAGKQPTTGKTDKKTSAQKPDPKTNKPNDQSGGGLFGLFGGKKK